MSDEHARNVGHGQVFIDPRAEYVGIPAFSAINSETEIGFAKFEPGIYLIDPAAIAVHTLLDDLSDDGKGLARKPVQKMGSTLTGEVSHQKRLDVIAVRRRGRGHVALRKFHAMGIKHEGTSTLRPLGGLQERGRVPT